MRTPQDITALYRQRWSDQAQMHQMMRTINEIYHREDAVAFPETDTADGVSVPNLLAQGIDQMAGRVASVAPQVFFTPTKQGVRSAERRAWTAAATISAWWQTERLKIKMMQRARHLIAYAMTPVTIRWDPRLNIPVRDVRDPLHTYPSPDVIPGTVTPTDVIYAYRRSLSWLHANGYGPQVYQVLGDRVRDTHPKSMLQLLEYVDEDGTHLILTSNATSADPGHWWDNDTAPAAATLEWAPSNGVMTSVVPTRVTLDRATGQFTTMIGMYYQQARLMALEIAAVEKGIFPDTYLVSRPGEVGRFLDGPYDGRTGKVNIIAGGDIKEVVSQPGYLTNPTIDRLERNQRVTAGIPAEFGGESQTNVRTGRRGDSILAATIDFPVHEAQELIAASLVEENKVAIALAKQHDGDTTRTLYVGVGNASRPVTYVANKVFETDQHTVHYPAVGTDINGLLVGIGQRVGMGTMSKWTAATLDPYIDSPEFEHDKIIAEGLEQSLVAGIQQQASSGQIPPATLAKIIQLVETDQMELADAITKATEDAAKEAQAEAAGMAGTTDPTAAPTAAALSGNPSIAPPPESQQNLASILRTLRTPHMGIKPDVGVGGRV